MADGPLPVLPDMFCALLNDTGKVTLYCPDDRTNYDVTVTDTMDSCRLQGTGQ